MITRAFSNNQLYKKCCMKASLEFFNGKSLLVTDRTNKYSKITDTYVTISVHSRDRF